MIATTLRRILQSIASRGRAFFYRLLGMKLDGKVWMEAIEWPARPGCIRLGKGAALDRGVTLLAVNDAAKIVVGAGCYINRHAMIDASESIEVGSETMIGHFCYITDHDHTIAPGQSPGAGPLVSAPTRIGNRCWIGAQASILKGVTIGDGTVVGAGSVVTRSLPAGVVAAGVPARVIRETGSRGVAE